MPLVRECWGQLADGERHIYFPLFESTVVEGIIKKVVANVLQIRTGSPQQGNGASLLVTGVRGVGKTTIMRGLSKILGELEDKIVCHYHDYEGTKVPLVDLLRPYLKRKLKLNDDGATSFRDMLAEFTGRRYGVVMFLDEIHRLYVEQTHPDYRQYVETIQGIYALGKTGPFSFGVVSGSSSNTRDLAYAKDDVAIKGSYPDLNNGVYREHVLRPLRSKSDFQAAVRLIGRPRLSAAAPINEENDRQVGAAEEGEEEENDSLERHFWSTGGVGRFMRGEVTGPSGIRTEKFGQELVSNVAFLALVAKLASVPPTGTAGDFPVQSLLHPDVVDIVEPRLAPGTTLAKTLNDWVDKGLLYRTEDGRYQLLVPDDNDNVFRRLYPNPTPESAGEHFVQAAILGTLLRWGGFPSAGHLIESYLRERLYDQFDRWEAVGEREPADGSPKRLDTTQLRTITREKLENLFFYEAADHGLDGVFICVDQDDAEGSQLELHALQIKSGDICRGRITPGGPGSVKDDSTVVGILAKAKNGIRRLTKTLREGMLGEDWAPSKVTFTLFTTKKLSEKALALLGQGFSVDDSGLQVECFLSTQEATLALFKDHHRRLAGHH